MNTPSTVSRVLSGVVAGLASAGAGLRFVLADWSPSAPFPTPELVSGLVVLAAATVLAHLRTHPWWGPLVVISALALAVTPVFVLEDALGLVAATIVVVPVAAYVTVVNLLVLGARLAVTRTAAG